jgi:hypothetical protein
MYTDTQIAWAAEILSLLPIILTVALLAHSVKIRALFAAGVVGGLAGFVVPEPIVHAQGTLEGLYIGHLWRSASHVFWWGTIGALLAMTLVIAVRLLRGQRLQFSLKTLLVVITGIAIITAAFCVVMN